MRSWWLPLAIAAKIPCIFGLSSPRGEQQLTLEGLGKRLQELHIGGKSKDSILASRLLLDLSCTRVGPSLVAGAGRGLFAAKDIQRGDLLTCYPGDILVYSPSTEASISSDDKLVWGSHVPESLRLDDDEVHSSLNGYILQVTDDSAILGLPSMDNDMAYAGHFANDGAQPPLGESQIASYVIASNDLSNAMHVPLEDCHMATVATRDIKEGNEVLVTYGPEYWREHSAGWNDYDEPYTSSTSNGKGFG